MKRSSCLFRKLNLICSCNGTLNRHALRISRGLCEASNVINSRRECCDKSCCDNPCCDKTCCDKGRCDKCGCERCRCKNRRRR